MVAAENEEMKKLFDHMEQEVEEAHEQLEELDEQIEEAKRKEKEKLPESTWPGDPRTP